MTCFDDFLVIKMLKNLKKHQKMLTLATLTVSMATNGFFAGNMKVPTCRACPRVLLVKFLWKSLERTKSDSKKTRFAGFRGRSPNFISVRLDTGRDSLRSPLFLSVKTQTSCTEGQHLKGNKVGDCQQEVWVFIAQVCLDLQIWVSHVH